MIRTTARRRTPRLAAIAVALLVGLAWAALKSEGDAASTSNSGVTTTTTTTTTVSAGSTTGLILSPPKVSPFGLRLQLRSATQSTRIAATRSVLQNPARYTAGTVRLAIGNSTKDLDAETYTPLGTILSTTTLDETTRGAAALALARLRPKFPDARLTASLNLVASCVTGGSGWPNAVRKVCAEAAGVANLSALTPSLQAMATSASEDELVALAAARAYTRMTGANSGFSSTPQRAVDDGLEVSGKVTP